MVVLPFPNGWVKMALFYPHCCRVLAALAAGEALGQILMLGLHLWLLKRTSETKMKIAEVVLSCFEPVGLYTATLLLQKLWVEKALALRCFEYTYIIVYTVEVVTSLAFMWLISRAALNAAAKRLKSHDVTYDITWHHQAPASCKSNLVHIVKWDFLMPLDAVLCSQKDPRLCCALPPSQASFTASSCFRERENNLPRTSSELGILIVFGSWSNHLVKEKV